MIDNNRRIKKINIVFSANPFMPNYMVEFETKAGNTRQIELPSVRFLRLMRSLRLPILAWQQTDVTFTPSDGWCTVTYTRNFKFQR